MKNARLARYVKDSNTIRHAGIIAPCRRGGGQEGQNGPSNKQKIASNYYNIRHYLVVNINLQYDRYSIKHRDVLSCT